MTLTTPAQWTVESAYPDLDPADPERVVLRTIASHHPAPIDSSDAQGLAESVLSDLSSHGFAVSPPVQFRPTADHMTFTKYGVSLAELGEDGDRIVILGHPDHRRVAAALNRYWRSVVGIDSEDLRTGVGQSNVPPESLTRVDAVFTEPAPGANTDWGWYCTTVPKPRPGPYDRMVAAEFVEFIVPVTFWDAP